MTESEQEREREMCTKIFEDNLNTLGNIQVDNKVRRYIGSQTEVSSKEKKCRKFELWAHNCESGCSLSSFCLSMD